MHRLRVRLSWCGCAISDINMYPEQSHNVHTNEAGRRLQAHNNNKAGPTESLGIGTRESLLCTGNSCPARRGGDGVGSGIQCMRLSYRGVGHRYYCVFGLNLFLLTGDS